MKIILAIFSVGLMVCSNSLLGQNLTYVRTNYQKAATNKSVCELLIKNLSKQNINNIELAYLGSLETIWAKYVGNPFSKLRTFKKGTEKIETAVKKDPSNLEIRCLRLSIQKNAPRFLGYNDAIKTDELYLKSNFNKISSQYLKEMIENILRYEIPNS